MVFLSPIIVPEEVNYILILSYELVERQELSMADLEGWERGPFDYKIKFQWFRHMQIKRGRI
jgi:hypothetical protein